MMQGFFSAFKQKLHVSKMPIIQFEITKTQFKNAKTQYEILKNSNKSQILHHSQLKISIKIN